jgi:hypothetical protein
MPDYTVEQIAAICNVSPRAVCKWFDSGALRGYYIGNRPHGQRKVPAEHLIRFLKEHGYPIPAELS